MVDALSRCHPLQGIVYYACVAPLELPRARFSEVFDPPAEGFPTHFLEDWVFGGCVGELLQARLTVMGALAPLRPMISRSMLECFWR